MTCREYRQQEAREEGERKLLLRLLRIKFGGLSADAESRVAAAAEETLLTWAERMVTATQLADVWGTG
jgi:hypothetical protein